MTLETSIIIRTRNEEKWLGEVLKKLSQQTYQNFEIIIVDSGSTDKTLEIVRSHSLTVIHIKPEEFTYPYAINVGIKNCNATKYLVILSAHSLPVGSTWLESGISQFSLQENILGVYGPLKALPRSTVWDVLFHNTSYLLTKIKMFPRKYLVVKTNGAGVLGFTNAIIRKDLWEKYEINEDFARGGEDNNWASYWFSKGYVAVKDLGFSVRHSHNLSFFGWKAQFLHWKDNSTPQPFHYLTYRNDNAHKKRLTD